MPAAIGAANLVTLARALLVVLIAGAAALPATPALALGVVAVASVAALLDLVDGWIARRTGTVSAFGARFDMETDALLILVLAALVWHFDKAGPWVLLSGLMRYLFVAAAWVWPWLRMPLPPSRRRQTVCVVQIVALILVLVPVVSPPPSSAVAAAALAALAWSFWVDVAWLRRAPTRPT